MYKTSLTTFFRLTCRRCSSLVSRGIQSLFSIAHGLDLCAEGRKALTKKCPSAACDEAEDGGSFLQWFISTTHVAAKSAQLLMCIRDKKVKKLVPGWLQGSLEALIRANFVGSAVENALDWRRSNFRQKFGLDDFLPATYTLDLLALEVPPAQRVIMDSRPCASSLAHGIHPLECEAFMHAVARSVANCVNARAKGVRVSVSRKRKASDSDRDENSQQEDE